MHSSIAQLSVAFKFRIICRPC